MSGRVRPWLLERGGLVALVALVIYALVAPAHLSTGDNAEFAALGTTGGAAHPPGYPLYVLWLRAWSWLPGSTPAHAAALATALLGAGTLWILHAACRGWGASASAASITVGVLAAAPLAVRLHSEAEVFALNGMIGAMVLWLAARGGPLSGVRRAFALGLVAGLGIANHHTCVLLAPVGLLGVVRGMRESGRGGVAAAAAIGGLVLGLSPYVYLLVAPDTIPSWGQVSDAGDLIHHFLRMDYGGPFQLGPIDHGGGPGENLLAFATTLARTYLWAPLALGIGALAVAIARPAGVSTADASRAETRTGWTMLALAFLLVGPVLVARFNLKPEGVTEFITRRFHLLPAIVLAVPLAHGLTRLGVWLASRAGALARSPALVQGLVAVGMVAMMGLALPSLARARSPVIEQGLRNILTTLPPDAVVIGTPDELHFGMGYLQGAVGLRPDVFVFMWQQVGLPHVRARVARTLGFEIHEQAEGSPTKLSVLVAEQILATGRPLFIDEFQGNIAGAFPIYPYGPLFRVLPRGTPLPSIHELYRINEELYGRFELGYERPHRSDVVPAAVHERYARTWQVIADGLSRAGDAERAANARQLAEALAPLP